MKRQNGNYETESRHIDGKYICRVWKDGRLLGEETVKTKMAISAAFREIFRWIDKGGGDAFTSQVRKRMFEDRNRGSRDSFLLESR